MVHICPDLFLIRPGFDKHDESQVTIQLVTPPRARAAHGSSEGSSGEEQEAVGGAKRDETAARDAGSAGKKRGRARGGVLSPYQQKKRSLKQQLTDANARMLIMRDALAAFARQSDPCVQQVDGAPYAGGECAPGTASGRDGAGKDVLGGRSVPDIPEADLSSDAFCARPLPAHLDEGPGHLFCSRSDVLDVDCLLLH